MTWDYELSVIRVSEKVREWKTVSLKKETLTDEIAKELYEARQQLDSRGMNSGNQNVPNGTFSQYLSEVGLARRTVHRWLEHFDPQEQRLLSDEEYESKKLKKQRESMAQEEAVKSRVNERIETTKKPDVWGKQEEKVFEQRLEQDKKNKEFREKIQKEAEQREVPLGKTKKAFEDINSMLNNLGQQAERKIELQQKMRLTGDNASHEFNEMLIDYLESLTSESQQLEACHNGIKIFKNYIRNLQINSVKEAL